MVAAVSEDDNLKAKQKHRTVTTILEWIQCFSLYVAVISRAHPEQVRALLGYQALIIQASIEYQGDWWLEYDRTFRLRAATQKGTTWSVIDNTLWNLAFSGCSRKDRCGHCCSLSHPFPWMFLGRWYLFYQRRSHPTTETTTKSLHSVEYRPSP